MPQYSTTNAPLPEVRPYYADYLNRAQEVANQGYQQSPGTYTAPNGYMQAGWQATANRAMQGSPVMSAANGALTNIMGGGQNGQAAQNAQAGATNQNANIGNGYMPMDNPYLNSSIQSAQGDLVNSWNRVQKPQWDQAMRNSGSFGNTGVAQSAQFGAEGLQQNLGRMAGDMRMGAYNNSSQLAENQANRMYQAGAQLQQNQYNDGQRYAGAQDAMGNNNRSFMQQALSMAPNYANQDYVDSQQLMNVGNQAQQFSQAAQNQNQSWFDQARQFPRDQLNVLGGALGMNQGSTQTQTAPDPSKASQVVGGALTGASLAKIIADLYKTGGG